MYACKVQTKILWTYIIMQPISAKLGGILCWQVIHRSSPVSSIKSKLVPPCSEHINALSGRGGRGRAVRIPLSSTGLRHRQGDRSLHSAMDWLNFTRWASAQGLSRSWAGNLDSCSSRLWIGLADTLPTDTPPSAIASKTSDFTYMSWLYHVWIAN